MPKVEPSPRFDKAFLKLARRDLDLRRQVVRAVDIFRIDPRHPGLNFEKVAGRDYCTIRVTRAVRIALRQSGPDSFELIDIGDHDTIYRRHE